MGKQAQVVVLHYRLQVTPEIRNAFAYYSKCETLRDIRSAMKGLLHADIETIVADYLAAKARGEK